MNNSAPGTENNNNILFYSMSVIKSTYFIQLWLREKHGGLTQLMECGNPKGHLHLWELVHSRWIRCDTGLDTSVAESRNRKWWHSRIPKHRMNGHINFPSEEFLKWTTYRLSKADHREQSGKGNCLILMSLLGGFLCCHIKYLNQQLLQKNFFSEHYRCFVLATSLIILSQTITFNLCRTKDKSFSFISFYKTVILNFKIIKREAAFKISIWDHVSV